MTSETKRKTQLEIGLMVWASVKHYATMKGLSISAAAESLLERGLEDSGYNVAGDMAKSDVERSTPTINQHVAP